MWPEVWTKIGKAAQYREKQEWKNEKPKLDNNRRLRGTYRNMEHSKNSQKRPMAAAMPCKRKVRTSTTKVRSRKLHPKRFPRQFMVEKWNLMNPQGNECAFGSLFRGVSLFKGVCLFLCVGVCVWVSLLRVCVCVTAKTETDNKLKTRQGKTLKEQTEREVS